MHKSWMADKKKKSPWRISRTWIYRAPKTTAGSAGITEETAAARGSGSTRADGKPHTMLVSMPSSAKPSVA